MTERLPHTARDVFALGPRDDGHRLVAQGPKGQSAPEMPQYTPPMHFIGAVQPESSSHAR